MTEASVLQQINQHIYCAVLIYIYDLIIYFPSLGLVLIMNNVMLDCYIDMAGEQHYIMSHWNTVHKEYPDLH